MFPSQVHQGWIIYFRMPAWVASYLWLMMWKAHTRFNCPRTPYVMLPTTSDSDEKFSLFRGRVLPEFLVCSSVCSCSTVAPVARCHELLRRRMWVSLGTTVAASSSGDEKGWNEGKQREGGREGKERGIQLTGTKTKERRWRRGKNLKQVEKINTGFGGNTPPRAGANHRQRRHSTEWEHEDTEPGNSKLMQSETKRERERVGTDPLTCFLQLT